MEIFRKWWFYAILIIVIIPVAVMAALFVPNGQTPAFLQSASGSVEVNSGAGYAPASEGMELSSSDRVRTRSGTAILVLYEHIIIRLEPNSEVLISELDDDGQKVEQQSGSIWTKVARLGGVENYKITTPTTVATVRGTTLRTRTGNGYELLVAEGTVGAQDLWCFNQSSEVDSDPRCSNVVQNHTKLVLVNGSYVLQNLSPEDLAAIREQLDIEIKVLRELRLREVLKNDMIMGIAHRKYDATDDDVAKFLIDIDERRRNESEIRDQIPVMTPDIKRILAFNAAIKDVMATRVDYG